MNIQQLQNLSKALDNLDNQNYFYSLPTSSKYGQFYFHLLSNNEDNAFYAEMFYGSESNKKQFRTFKNRYKHLLIDAYYTCKIDSSQITSTFRFNEISIIKGMVSALILMNQGLSKESLLIWRSVFLKAEGNHLITIMPYILHNLLERYLFEAKGKKELDRLIKYRSKVLELNKHYGNIHNQYISLGHNYVIGQDNFNQKDLIQIKINMEKLKSNDLILDSFFPTSQLYSLLALLDIYTKNTTSLISTCTEALEKLKALPKINNSGIQIHSLRLGIAYLSKREFSKALDFLDLSSEYGPKRKLITWHLLKNYYFITYILKQDYKNAVVVLNEIYKNDKLSVLPSRYSNNWYIYEAFIHFLIKTKKIDSDSIKDIPLRSFRLSRFMNEVSHFSKDKKGYNITINILQALFLIADKKYDAATDKFHALKQYSYRYLRKPEFIRPRSFINMLQSIPSGHFHKKLVEQRSAKHRKVLENNPMDYSEKSLGLEIVPYEQLWQEVLHLLDPKQN